ncbi:MAG: response regulator [Bacteroidota bacterium]
MTAQILIIEDEPNLLSEIAEQLTFEDYQTLTASNGEEGLQRIREHHLDLIITDIAMPKLDGIDVVQAVRQNLQLTTPIILMSAFEASQFSDRLETIPNTNISAILRKPVPLSTLLDAVSEALS